MSCCNRIGYIHKSGTGQNPKNLRSSVISSIFSRCSYNINSFVNTHLHPPPAPDTSDAMSVYGQYKQPVVHMLESSRSTVRNANYVQSALSSMADTNYNGDGVFSASSSRRLPAYSNYPPDK